MRYFLQLSYHGKAYSGWQRQDNAISIQQVLEENLSKIFSETIEITGCGRTDTGVHAHQYYAHLNTEKSMPDNFLYRINNMLPDSISIHRIFEVGEHMHARFNALQRTYKYFVHFEKNPFIEDQSYLMYNWKPDIEKMNHCIQQLLGEHDFSTFEKKGSDNKTSVCRLDAAEWVATENGLVFTVTSDRFLRNMVRRMTATLLLVGIDKLNEQQVVQAVLNKEMLEVKLAVPAKGLFLWDIRYDF